MGSPTDSQWYLYLSGQDDDELCWSCRDELADPDDIDGFCNWCAMERDEEEC